LPIQLEVGRIQQELLARRDGSRMCLDGAYLVSIK